MFTIIKFALKSFFFVGVVAAGGALAVNNIPALRANIIEYVNPRAKEARLLGELDTQLTAVGETLVREAVGTSPAERARRVREIQNAVAKAQELVSEIGSINDESSGLVDGAITKLIDAVVPSRTASPSPSPAAFTTTSPLPGTTTAPVVPNASTTTSTPAPSGSTLTPVPCVP